MLFDDAVCFLVGVGVGDSGLMAILALVLSRYRNVESCDSSCSSLVGSQSTESKI